MFKYFCILFVSLNLSAQININKTVLITQFGYSNTKQIKEIRLFDKNATRIEPFTFEEYKNYLEILVLNHNQLTQLEPHTFTDLFKLKVLSLSNNQLTSIDKIFLNNIDYNESESIYLNRVFSLNDVELVQIPLYSFVFNGLRNLEYLWLDFNKLTKLQRFTFDDLINLKELYLNNNKLDAIEDLTFSQLNRLECLWLQNNHLKQISSDIFIGLKSLNELLILNNKFTIVNASISLPSLTTLSLANNSLFRMIDYSETKISYLKANSSIKVMLNLKRTNIFKHLTHLEVLYLNDNQLMVIFSSKYRYFLVSHGNLFLKS